MSAPSLRLALISPEYPPLPGGVGDYTACLAAALVRTGVAEVHVLTSVSSAGAVQDPFPGAGCAGTAEAAAVFVHRSVARWDWSCWGVLERMLRDVRAGAALIQYQTAAYGLHGAINTFPRRLALSSGNPPVVTTFHDLREPFLFRGAGFLRRHANLELIRGSRALVVTNAEDLAALPAFAAGRAWPIPIGPNVVPPAAPSWTRESWRAAHNVPAGTIVIAYFGFINSSKGLDTLIEALRLLNRPGGDRRYELLIVGGDVGQSDVTNVGTAAEVKQLILDLGLAEIVHWTGYLPPAGVSAALMSSDLAALPFRDGASFRRGSLLAALAHGLPVVTTLPHPAPVISGWPELRHRENALLVPPGDPPALAAAVSSLAADPPLRARLAKGAAALGRWFSWDAIAARYLDLVDSLSNRQPG